MSLQETGAAKPAVHSLGVWGGIVSILTSLLIYAAGQGWIESDLASLVIGLFGPAAALAGGVAAIWGRIRAQAPIEGMLK